ncbi:MAG TPA: hypothetical protein VFI29_11180 [Hanamia sp.]|nr:hypothetical protein [Hanamia sp.]
MDISLLYYTPQLYYYPFYTEEDKRKVLKAVPEQVGSCVLFKTDKEFFLITTKHSFDHIQASDIIIFLKGDNIIHLPNDTGFNISTKQLDNIDMLIIRLPFDIVEKLSTRYSFLHYKNIDFNHNFDLEKPYMLLGFINRQTDLKNNKFSATPFGFLTTTKQYKKIDTLGFTYFENIILKYNRRKQSFLFDTTISFGPKDLKGLSGGGIWYCQQDLQRPHLNFCFLVGIMIQERTNRGIMIGTKIRFAIDILYQHFGVALKISQA